MKAFEASISGRILTVAVALPLLAGGFVPWDTAGSGAVWIIGSVFAGTLLGIFGTGWAIREHFIYAILAVLFLPPALLAYTPLVAIAAGIPALRTAMLLAGIVLVAFALRPAIPRFGLAPARRAARHSI
jgi:hypothetical protein